MVLLILLVICNPIHASFFSESIDSNFRNIEMKTKVNKKKINKKKETKKTKKKTSKNKLKEKKHPKPEKTGPVGFVVGDDPSWGRLGNQLFVVSTILAYAWDHNFTPVFPYFNRPYFAKETDQLTYNRDRIFFRLNTSDFPHKIHKQYSYAPLAYKPIPRCKNNTNLSLQGQFVSWKYLHHHYDKLVALFEPCSAVLDHVRSKYAKLIENPNTVAIHVRTYSKDLHEGGLPFVGINFFKLALAESPNGATFVIFSDRINWCKVNFQKLFPDKSFVFIEGNDPIEDLHLMSLMKHQIISNSTYSWWGAYLNKNPNKIVICPQQLLRKASSWPIQDCYLPDWRVIQHNFTVEPYPEDIADYDEKTSDDTKKY